MIVGLEAWCWWSWDGGIWSCSPSLVLLVALIERHNYKKTHQFCTTLEVGLFHHILHHPCDDLLMEIMQNFHYYTSHTSNEYVPKIVIINCPISNFKVIMKTNVQF